MSKRELQFYGLKGKDLLEAGPEDSLAIAVVSEAATLKPPNGVGGNFGVKEVPNLDFDTFIAAYIAETLLRHPDPKLPNLVDRISKGEPGAGESETASTRALAQLACYAQREWKDMPILCPVEGRLSSLFLALSRLHRDNYKFWIKVFDQINVALQTKCPILENPWESQAWTGLKTDRNLYEQDLLRTEQDQGYAMLPATEGGDASVEMIRISKPKSLLFDLWAWEDTKNSREHHGFPLVWIEDGWGSTGLQLRLSRSSRLKALAEVSEFRTVTARDGGYTLTWDKAGHPTACDVLWALKRKLFAVEKCAYWDFPLAAQQEMPLKLLIDDSDLPAPARLPQDEYQVKENYFRFVQVEYSADVDIFQTWAGNEIAKILYSSLREDPKQRLPNSFTDEHIDRLPGIVSVWTRHGLAVAYQHRHLAHVENLRKEFEILARMPSGFVEALKSGDTSAMHALIKQHFDCTVNVSKPEYRPLRSFMERLHSQQVYDAFREYTAANAQQTALEAQHDTLKAQQETLEAQKESRDAQRDSLSEIENMQSKLEVLEVAIFVFYVTEVTHILAESFWGPLGQIVAIAVAATICGILAYCYLVLWKKGADQDPAKKVASHKHSHPSALIALFGAIAFLYIAPAFLALCRGPAHLRDEHEILHQSHQKLEAIARQVDELKLSLKEGRSATDKIDGIAQSLRRLEEIFASTKPATPGNVVKK